jgi:ABC-type polysaccharide/polyol phosphate transport system ATPase subunit
MARVKFENVSFDYPLYGLASRSLKVTLLRQMAGASRIAAQDGTVRVQALRDVSFDVSDGDRLGLIGVNGAGKSTTLRVIAGLAHPTSGKLTVEGRLLPLIEKGLGISPELTGRANIELPLRLLGASDAEVRRAQDFIPEFTGLGEFINLPVRTYSDGMKTRLSFAICTFLNADLIVLDEWIASGDLAFREKAETRLVEILKDAGVVVIASHSIALVQQVCNKLVWLDQGQVRMFGSTKEVLDAYIRHTKELVAADKAEMADLLAAEAALAAKSANAAVA